MGFPSLNLESGWEAVVRAGGGAARLEKQANEAGKYV
jgi:hypothetical protein